MINSNCNLLPKLFEGVPRNKGSKKRISQRLINLRFAILHMHNHTCWGRVICQMFYTSKIPNPLNFTQYLVDLQLLKIGGKEDRILDDWEVGGRVQLEPGTPQPPEWLKPLAYNWETIEKIPEGRLKWGSVFLFAKVLQPYLITSLL